MNSTSTSVSINLTSSFALLLSLLSSALLCGGFILKGSLHGTAKVVGLVVYISSPIPQQNSFRSFPCADLGHTTIPKWARWPGACSAPTGQLQFTCPSVKPRARVSCKEPSRVDFILLQVKEPTSHSFTHVPAPFSRQHALHVHIGSPCSLGYLSKM